MIEVTGVNKMFGEIKALDNIVATIQEGSIFGLIGTNGAASPTAKASSLEICGTP